MTQYGSNFRIRQDYPTDSLLLSIEKLCEIEVKKCLRTSDLQQSPKLQKFVKPVRKSALDALFRSSGNADGFPEDLLQQNDWTVGEVVSAVAFRMRVNQRRFYEADKLEDLSHQLLDENSENSQVLSFLLHLSDVENHRAQKRKLFQVPTTEEIRKLARRKCPIVSGDFPFKLLNSSYTLPNFKSSAILSDPIMYPELGNGISTDLLHANKYKNPDFERYKEKNGLFGFRSKFFSHQSLTNSTYEIDSQTRLYGGLRHSRTFDLDIKMSYPKLTGPIDLLASVSMSTDEGFVSPSSSFSSTDTEWQESAPQVKQAVPLPYFDYKVPRHDLHLWRNCLTHDMYRHYTWEALGLPAGSTEKRAYLTEAGSKIFNEIWKQRCLLIHRLTDFFGESSLSKVIWVEFDEKDFVKYSSLVAMGVPSDVFQFNASGCLFSLREYVYFSGVDPEALRSLLLRFCRWGTCYRRLLKFSRSGDPPLQNSSLDRQGAVFKAFVAALKRYLREYLSHLLSFNYKSLSLLTLAARMRKIGDQIEYIAFLCRCGDPEQPIPSSLPGKTFPTGIQLLSYLYDEVVRQSESCNYLTLLYFLKKSCAPYLQFIRNWIFRGQCWDVHGEFMLRVNLDYGTRRDRQQWLKYVEPANPGDPASCVPSFLVVLASAIYTCGRTISLMQSICPSHFLVVDGSDSPDLEITFSKRKLQKNENDWGRHRNKMVKIENQRSVNWLIIEEEKKAASRRASAKARKAARDGLIKMQEALILERQKKAKRKEKEFKRLKKQAEDAAEKRSAARRTELEEDHKRETERQNSEKKLEDEKKRMILEEKEKMVSYYDELNREADRRIRKANWSKRRNMLTHARLQFLAQDEKLWKSQGVYDVTDARKSSEVPPSPLELALQAINSGLSGNGQTSALIQFSPDKQPNTKAQRKAVQGVHVSQTSMEPDIGIGMHRRDVHGSHVSQTSMEPGIGVGMHRKAVHGEHVSQTSMESDIGVGMQRKAVHGAHVSQTSMDSDIGAGMHRKAVQGAHVSQTTIDTASGAQISKRTVDGRHVSSTSDEVFESPEILKPFKKIVPGQNVSSSTVGSLMTDNQDGVPQKFFKKSVTGQSISDSSINDLLMSHDGVAMPIPADAEHVKTFRKTVAGHSVSSSSVGSLLTDSSSSEPHSRTFKKAVPGQSVSSSSIGSILSQESIPEKSFKKCVAGHSISNSSVGDILRDRPFSNTESQTKPLKKTISGQSVSASTVGEIMASESNITLEGSHVTHSNTKMAAIETELGNGDFSHASRSVSNSSIQRCIEGDPVDLERFKKFGLANKFHGKHSSQSSISTLVYYDDTIPWLERRNIVSSDSRLLKTAVNESKRHPSFSTVQLLMYRESPTEGNTDVPDATQETFHLQLPAVINYFDPRSYRVNSDKFGQSVDLMGKFFEDSSTDDVSNFGSADASSDDVSEFWKSDVESVHLQLLPALLNRCIVRPIAQQITLVNRCALNYFMIDLNLLHHFEMMRHFCFMEDGEFGEILCSKLFEKMRNGCRPPDLLNPVALESLISQAVQGSSQRNSADAKRLTFSLHHIPAVFSAQDPDSLECFTLKYDIGWPHNIVITEANHSKYGQVFGFLLRLKRVMWALIDITKKLSSAGDSWEFLSGSELRRIHLYRHEMHNFVKVMQGYVSTQVVHVCWHEFLQSLQNAKCVEDLHTCHVDYLQKCVFRCLLTKKTKMVMSVITDVFKTILRFWTQLFSKSVKFAELNVTYSNFSKYSGFLFKVVSKLVHHGYQPPLEDFLLRLNFNGVYGE